jgi:aryl-alcohol dehydrogenase-like predicted oxidoreductase
MKSLIGLGTAAIGRPQYINIRQEEQSSFDLKKFKKRGIKVLDKAYDMGIRYFDTAPGYGMAEELVARWIRDKMDVEIEIASKWGYTYTANFDPNAVYHEVKELSLSKLKEQWTGSKRLFPNFRVYQIHSATLESGVLDNEEVLNRLHEIKEEYLLKIGITTSGEDQVEVIKKALDVQVGRKQLFDCFQVTYNILEQNLTEISEELHHQKKLVIVKEAMANGRIFRNLEYPGYNDLYDYLDTLAEKYQVGVDAIGLRFCIDSLQPYKVLSGACTPDHVEQNLKALDFKLEQEEIEKLICFEVKGAKYWTERKQLTWN